MSTWFTCSATVWLLTNPPSFLLFAMAICQLKCGANLTFILSRCCPQCADHNESHAACSCTIHTALTSQTQRATSCSCSPSTPPLIYCAWSTVPPVGWGIVDSASFMRLCVPASSPPLLPRLAQHPCLHPVQSSLFMNCAAIFQLQFELPLRLLRFTTLRFGCCVLHFLLLILFALSSVLHFIWLACNLFLAAFFWPFIMLCYLAVNLCPMHVAKFRDRSNKWATLPL